MKYTTEQIVQLLADYEACANLPIDVSQGEARTILALFPCIAKQQADRIKELETALRHIESKGHLSSKMAARVARAALRDFTISGTRRALGGDA